MSDVVELVEVPERFGRWLAGRPLAERSRREYARNARAYCTWLEQTPDRVGWQGDPLSDPLARDHAARDFRRYLQVAKGGGGDGEPGAGVAGRAVPVPGSRASEREAREARAGRAQGVG